MCITLHRLRHPNSYTSWRSNNVNAIALAIGNCIHLGHIAGPVYPSERFCIGYNGSHVLGTPYLCLLDGLQRQRAQSVLWCYLASLAKAGLEEGLKSLFRALGAWRYRFDSDP